MGHVRDGHGELPPPRPGGAVHRIVEVLRVRAVDGDEGTIAQIVPFARVGRRAAGDFARDPLRFRQHVVRPDVGDLVPPDRDFGRHARPPGVAQALHDPAGRLPPPEGPLREFHHHHFAFAGVPFAAVRLHHHVLVEAAMIGGHQRGPAGAKETADDPPVVPLQHLDHGSRKPVREPPARGANAGRRRRSGRRA